MMSVSQTTWPLVWTCPALRLSSVISLSCSMSLLNSRPGCSCLDSTAMGNIHHGRFFLERCLGHSGATFFSSSFFMRAYEVMPVSVDPACVDYEMKAVIYDRKSNMLVKPYFIMFQKCPSGLWSISSAVEWKGFSNSPGSYQKVSVKEVNSCQQQFSFTRCQQSCSLLRCICGSLYLEL